MLPLLLEQELNPLLLVHLDHDHKALYYEHRALYYEHQTLYLDLELLLLALQIEMKPNTNQAPYFTISVSFR